MWAECGDHDLVVYLNLIAAELVEIFFDLYALGNHTAQFHLLQQHRRSLLEPIHKAQKRLDCLDDLLHRLGKSMGKSNSALRDTQGWKTTAMKRRWWQMPPLEPSIATGTEGES